MAARKKSIKDLLESELSGKKVLVRCDLNVPLDDSQVITDATRIVKSLPTLQYLIEKGAFVTVCSHLGRPKNGPEEKFSLKPVQYKMEELLKKECNDENIEVKLAPDCIGDEAKNMINSVTSCKTVTMLENTRFYKEETKNDEAFVKALGQGFDVYVNDAFGTAHRAHASTEGVTKVIGTSVSGFLMAKELEYLDGAVNNTEGKIAAIVGGSKVSSKITVLNALVDKCDVIIIGGGMVFTFLKAQGLGVGTSLVEDDFVETAKGILEKVKKTEGKQIILPDDIVVADKFDKEAESKVVSAAEIPSDWMGLDNGPATTEKQKKALEDISTIVMNGPMGVFEFPKFAKGTMDLINILADLTKDKGVTTIIGGGDSVAATEQSGRASDMSHISTGGGASLELLEGKQLPGVVALHDA